MNRFKRQFYIWFQLILHKKIQSSVYSAEIIMPASVFFLIHILHEYIPHSHIPESQFLLHDQNLLLHLTVKKCVHLPDINNRIPVFFSSVVSFASTVNKSRFFAATSSCGAVFPARYFLTLCSICSLDSVSCTSSFVFCRTLVRYPDGVIL